MKAMNNTTNQAPAKRSKAKWIVIAAVLLLVAAIAVSGIFLFPKGEESVVSGDWLASKLENSKVTTITLEGDCYLEGPVQIRGEKIIEGEGTIFFAGEAEESLKWKDYQIPEDECYLLGIPELEERAAMFTMEKGSSLTIGGKVAVNALGKALVVNVPADATLTIRDDALITGGLAANIVNRGAVSVEGGTVLADAYFGIMNYAKLSVTGGTLESNAKNMACVVSGGETVVSGGGMKAESSTNIYVTDGKLSVTGGALETAAFDNIYVAKGTAEITGGTITGGHGVHNAGGNVNVTGGQWLSSSHALYNEGDMTVTGVTIEKTLNHAIVNRGEKAKLVAKDVTIGTATVHGVYNIRGAHMEVENLSIDNAMGKGVHNGGAFFTGKNVTINRTMGAGVGNEREKGWQQDGTLTIQGLTVKKAGSKNIVCTAGEVNVSDATLGSIQSNSVQVSGGVVNLKDVEISGTVGSGALHGIYLTDGVVNAENVTIGSTIGRGIQNRGAQFNGKNITIKDSRATGIGNQLSTDGTKNGTITIDGLEMSGGRGYYIHNVDGGTIDIKNGNVTIANNTGLRVDNGLVKLTNFTMTGKGSAVTYNGFTVNGGKLDLKNVTLENMTGRGINNMGGTVTGSDVTVLNNKATAIYNEGGKTQLTKVSTSGIKGYNADAKGGTLELTDATLGKSGSTSINVDAGANVILKRVVVNGTQKGHGVYVHKRGRLTFEKLTISNAAARALSNGNTSSKVEGGTVVGTNLTITKPVATAIGNDSGTMKLENVKVTDCTANTVNVKSGAVTINAGELCKTGGTNVVLDGGELNLKNVNIQGTTKDNGITATAGKVTVDNVTVTGAAGRGINNIGATITGTGLTVTKAGASAIYNEGTIVLKNVNLSESTGYNIDVKKGTLKITDGKLAVTPVSNVSVSAGAAAELANIQILGTTSAHAVTVLENATLILNEVSIADSAAQALNNRGGKITGSMVTISNAGATAIANESGTMEISGVEVTGSTGYNLDVKTGSVKLTKGAHTGILASTNVANVNVAANETAELTLEGITVKGSATKGAIVVGNNAKAAFKDVTVNGEDGLTNGYAISAGNNSTVDLTNVKINGTTNQNAVYVATGAQVKIAGLTVTGGKKNALTNNGGVITGSGLNVSGCGTVAVYNAKGDMTLGDVNVTGGTGHSVNVDAGNVKLTNATLSNATLAIKGGTTELTGSAITGVTADKTHGINMTGGTVTLQDVTVTNVGGAEARGIYQSAGTLTLTGTTTLGNCKLIGFQPAGGTTYINGTVIVTDTPNSINVGANGQVHIGENGKLTSNVGVYLPKNGYLTMDAATIGNTAEEPLKIRSSNITAGSVLVKASSAEAAENALSCVKLLSEDLLTEVSGTNIVVINRQQEEEEKQEVIVSDWAALVAAVDSAEAGKPLTIVLTQSITQPADGGSATVKGGKIVTVTDGGNGYTITRTASGALFQTGYDGTLTFDGKLTIANTNTSGTALANNGNMTLNNTKLDFSAAYNIISMNSDNAAQTGGHDLILKNVTMTNVTLTIKGGTVEAEDLAISGVSTASKHGVNMTGGTVTLKGNVTISDITGSNARGIYQAGGTLTVSEDAVLTLSNNKLVGGHFSSGTTYINGTIIDTNTANSVNCGVSNVHLGAKGKIVSDIGVYLPKNGYLTMDAATIGNTADEPLKIRPDNITSGSVLVKASSAEAAQNVLSCVKLLNENLYIKVSGTNIVATNQQQEGEEEQEKQEVTVSDWASLKTTIEGAEAGAILQVTLSQDITQPADGGSIAVKDSKNVTITDGGNGYTITRSATGAALFATEGDGTLIISGKVTVNGGTGSVMELVSAGNLNLSGVTLENVSLKITGGTANLTNTTVTGVATGKKHGINMTGGTVTLHNVTVTNISGAEARGIYQSAGTLTLTGTTTLSGCKLIGFQPAGGTTYIRGTILDTNTANSINVGGGATVYLNADAKIISNIGIYLPSSGKLQLEQGVTSIGNSASEPLKIRHNNMTASGFIVLKTDSAEAAGNIAPCVVILNGTTTNTHASYQVAVSGNNVITNKIS